MSVSSQSFRRLLLRGVGRSFGNFTALRDLSLDIQRGEFIALLGPSGCGKSTALNCLAGLLPTSSGSIWLDETRIDTLAAEKRGFGMVFQNYALFPHMTIRDNVAFGLRMRGQSRADCARLADQALATVRLENQADKLPGQLSGGQQQRVAIARAIAIAPPIVLMDEPLSNLDAKLRLEMRQEIRRIHAGLGSITIYVTHDQDEALSLADRIVVLRDGAVRQVGTPEDLYARPDHLDVADFMGFRNRLPGRLVAQHGTTALVEVEGVELEGTLREALGSGRVILSVRPDDLVAGMPEAGGIGAVVEAIEYRGRDFFGVARSPGGHELHFRAERKYAAGDRIGLRADPARSLVFAEAS